MAPEMDPMLWRRQSLQMHLRAARMQEVAADYKNCCGR
jgi:hypothetical protein